MTTTRRRASGPTLIAVATLLGWASGAAGAEYIPIDPRGVAYVDVDSLASSIGPVPTTEVFEGLTEVVRRSVARELEGRPDPGQALDRIERLLNDPSGVAPGNEAPNGLVAFGMIDDLARGEFFPRFPELYRYLTIVERSRWIGENFLDDFPGCVSETFLSVYPAAQDELGDLIMTRTFREGDAAAIAGLLRELATIGKPSEDDATALRLFLTVDRLEAKENYDTWCSIASRAFAAGEVEIGREAMRRLGSRSEEIDGIEDRWDRDGLLLSIENAERRQRAAERLDGIDVLDADFETAMDCVPALATLMRKDELRSLAEKWMPRHPDDARPVVALARSKLLEMTRMEVGVVEAYRAVDDLLANASEAHRGCDYYGIRIATTWLPAFFELMGSLDGEADAEERVIPVLRSCIVTTRELCEGFGEYRPGRTEVLLAIADTIEEGLAAEGDNGMLEAMEGAIGRFRSIAERYPDGVDAYQLGAVTLPYLEEREEALALGLREPPGSRLARPELWYWRAGTYLMAVCQWNAPDRADTLFALLDDIPRVEPLARQQLDVLTADAWAAKAALDAAVGWGKAFGAYDAAVWQTTGEERARVFNNLAYILNLAGSAEGARTIWWQILEAGSEFSWAAGCGLSTTELERPELERLQEALVRLRDRDLPCRASEELNTAIAVVSSRLDDPASYEEALKRARNARDECGDSPLRESGSRERGIFVQGSTRGGIQLSGTEGEYDLDVHIDSRLVLVPPLPASGTEMEEMNDAWQARPADER